MATHAGGDLRRIVGRSRATPRATYNVGARCRAIALSIAVLLIVFLVLILI